MRLCDVAPDGASTLVSWGLLNLTHRDPHGHEFPAPLEPGQVYTVTVRLNAVGHTILPGHRWRLAVSPTYWPHAWPSPEAVTLTLFTGGTEGTGELKGSWLTLPVRLPRPEDAHLPPFEEPEGSAPLEVEMLRPASRQRTYEPITNHPLTNYQLTDRHDDGRCRFVANGLEYESRHTETWSIVEGAPLSAQAQCEWLIAFQRGDWATRIETNTVLTCDATTFRVTNTLDAYEGERRVFSKTWRFAVPRDLV